MVRGGQEIQGRQAREAVGEEVFDLDRGAFLASLALCRKNSAAVLNCDLKD
jgi:hypothetical protein